MKLSKNLKLDLAVPIEEWRCFDNCPVCRLFKRAILTGKEISGELLEEAFAEAEAEVEADTEA